MSRCIRCEAFLWRDQRCKCRRFEVSIPEYDADGYVFATNHKEAAEKFTEDWDCTEPCLIDDSTKVIVESADGEVKTFNVGAEAFLEYSAAEITGGDA